MAVITQYVVVREGLEGGQVFSVKKEAEAYDKMLDAADRLAALIREGDLSVDIDARTIDELSVLLAKNGPEVVKILKGVKTQGTGMEPKPSKTPPESSQTAAPKNTRGRKPKRKA